MISVNKALEHIFELAKQLEAEQVSLKDASGRILARSIIANRDQPPFSASAMDGYAICGEDLDKGIKKWTVIGEAGAGHRFGENVTSGQATRIFTGAPMPKGTNQVIIQENVELKNHSITLCKQPNLKKYVRQAGSDFTPGFTLKSPRHLTPRDIALMAAMNSPMPWVTKKPKIVIIGTGDELVQPGEQPNENQIIASNTYGLAAMFKAAGASPRLVPIARDRLTSLEQVFSLIGAADTVVTVGGASVGDYDLVSQAASNFGMIQSFYKVAMRPGKPLMAGFLKGIPIIGLPGNPVSAMVCGEVFLIPLIQKMLGLPATPRLRQTGPIGHNLPHNGSREHYMRAKVKNGVVFIEDQQDSSLLSILATSDALAVRPKNAEPLQKGSNIEYIPL